MSAGAYELLSLAMRYVFAGLMVLIVLRAWRITFIDNRRAARLRRLSPDTGVIGEMLVLSGGERAKPGMRYPLTLEGAIGSGRRSDIRIRHSSVRSRHAIYQMSDEGLFVRGHARARIRDGRGRLMRNLLLHDGEILRIGDVALMLVLTDGDHAPEERRRTILRRRHGRSDDFRNDEPIGDDFDPPIFREGDFSDEAAFSPDELFMSNPAGNFADDEFSGENSRDPYDFFRPDYDEDVDDDY